MVRFDVCIPMDIVPITACTLSRSEAAFNSIFLYGFSFFIFSIFYPFCFSECDVSDAWQICVFSAREKRKSVDWTGFVFS